MPGKIQLRSKNKSGLFSGDFIVVLVIFLGFLLTGGFYFKTSKYPDRGAHETVVITPAQSGAKEGLQLGTFNVEHCASNTAIDFLIDNSGSMQFGSKMDELKKALNLFAGRFPQTGAIAMQTYSENVRRKVDFSLFRDSQSTFLDAVNSMRPQTATHSKDAFQAAQTSLNQGKVKFPDYKFSLVFISDGIPETRNGNLSCGGGDCGGGTCTGVLQNNECKNGVMRGGSCSGGTSPEYCMEHPINPNTCRCFDPNQDPREIANQIKASGVRIFTIAFTDTLADAYLNSKLQSLMREVASAPTDYYLAPIDSQLTDIINQIAIRVCSKL